VTAVPGNVAEIEATPTTESVVTDVEPRYRSPSPFPLLSGSSETKNSTV
jgi:hypothetical protein